MRVTTIEPGAVATEFAAVAGYPPGTIEARVVIQALEQPRNVDIAELTVYPTKQTGLDIFANAVTRQQ